MIRTRRICRLEIGAGIASREGGKEEACRKTDEVAHGSPVCPRLIHLSSEDDACYFDLAPFLSLSSLSSA